MYAVIYWVKLKTGNISNLFEHPKIWFDSNGNIATFKDVLDADKIAYTIEKNMNAEARTISLESVIE